MASSWREQVALIIVQFVSDLNKNDLVYFCALVGYVFVHKIGGVPWASDCIRHTSAPMHCFLATLFTSFPIHPINETESWASSLKLFTRITRDSLGECPMGMDAYIFGHSLLPWSGMGTHQHGFRNLS